MLRIKMIFLIGMPGVGKSYWGRRWAAENGWQFCDLDDEIMHRSGLSISAIFEQHGEPFFRDLEAQTLAALIDESHTANSIIATGGGAACQPHNMARMKAAGCVVCLHDEVPALLKKIRKAHEVRPLLNSLSVEVLTCLQAERAAAYSQAHLQIEVSMVDEGTFAQIQSACTNLRL